MSDQFLRGLPGLACRRSVVGATDGRGRRAGADRDSRALPGLLLAACRCLRAARRSFLLLLALLAGAVDAAEYRRNEQAIPPTLDAQRDGFDNVTAAREPVRPGWFRPHLRDRQGLPQWLRETRFSVNTRTYALDRAGSGTGNGSAAAVGGELALETGAVRGWHLGGTWMVSERIEGNARAGATGLLGAGGRDLHVLGTGFLRYEGDHWHATLFRQELDLPYLNRNDARMLPNTFEAYTVVRRGDRVDMIGGYVAEMKTWTEDAFRPLARVAGTTEDDGLWLFGWGYRFAPGTDLGILVLESSELFRTTYLEGHHGWTSAEGLELKLSLQYTDQRSIGAEALGAFETWAGGARIGLGWRHALLTASATRTADDRTPLSPYGGRPGFTSMMIRDFDRADEKAWVLGLSYEFGRFGWPGVGVSANYGRGRDAREGVTGAALPDAEEWDLSLELRPKSGRFAGLWLRVRYATADVDGSGGAAQQLRLIANYTLPFT